MRVFAAGQSPTGIIAIGQVPTGIIAIGQGATGVIAIGQLARGVVAVGQLALGVVAFGQLAVGLAWGGGMLAFGGLEGPTMLGLGAFGRLRLRSLRRLRLREGEYRLRGGRGRWIVHGLWLGVLVLVWFAALDPLLHDITREGGIFRDAPGPRVLR